MGSWIQADAEMVAEGEQVLRILLDNGYEAYWVGGCVRDALMGRPVNDLDITTSALPEEVISLFERTVPTGMEHGTVTVLRGKFSYEVTTYRVEGAYENHRRPAEVSFVRKLSEDLLRRDFTMNAIARSLRGELVDPYGGAVDIEHGIIRCVGEAKLRFHEDALRMLRCIRFAAVFDYSIAYNTWKGLRRERNGISYIAVERIRTEMEKLMASSHPVKGLALLERSGMMQFARIPFTYHPDHAVISLLDHVPDSETAVRWVILFNACGISGAEAARILKQWTFSNERIQEITSILYIDNEVIHCMNSISNEQMKIKWIQLTIQYGKVAAKRWLFLRNILNMGPTELTLAASCWLKDMTVYSLNELNITGTEVITVAERKSGPWVGDTLKHLLLKVASGDLDNDRTALIEEVKRVISDEKR
ncbi:CCA tRNA nucleotidyltransferase [Paenibacillus pini]|uniref:tRNA nucleotidyltransferase n=1 Tax=Paenibacillus pini JCM 16418 TaxID=1236976 RepID=W7YDW3_9BACL|nr:CCA tRNA nucleotidyltransferase [Paenibacillus pini]GAF09095.1 tRNA nucleotidyltransferase [Paenibacillus pini JCM 16418]